VGGVAATNLLSIRHRHTFRGERPRPKGAVEPKDEGQRIGAEEREFEGGGEAVWKSKRGASFEPGTPRKNALGSRKWEKKKSQNLLDWKSRKVHLKNTVTRRLECQIGGQHMAK